MQEFITIMTHDHTTNTEALINPRRMREGYGTCFVIRSFVRSFVRSVGLSVSSAAELSDHFCTSVKV